LCGGAVLASGQWVVVAVHGCRGDLEPEVGVSARRAGRPGSGVVGGWSGCGQDRDVEELRVSEVFRVDNAERAVLDVVFVHGLNGNARETWSREDQRSFWPQWLAADVADVAVWTVDYDAWSSGWRGRSMSMQDRAINLLALLQSHDIGERPLCFVTHSMGGLLAKAILMHAAEGRTEYAPFATVTKGVVFLATPHNGSGITKAVKALGVLYRGTAAVKDLKRNAGPLRKLDRSYRNWVKEVEIRHLVFFEKYKTRMVRVVDEDSADPNLAGVEPIPVEANHIDICKPLGRESLVYGKVRRFVAALCAEPAEPAPSAAKASLAEFALRDAEFRHRAIRLVPLAEHVGEALEAARASCEAMNRKFVTPNLVFALLELPGSRAARCFEQTKLGLVREWCEHYSYIRPSNGDDRYPYLILDLDKRFEVQQAKVIAWRNHREFGHALMVNEVHVLLGVLSNQQSRTRRELAERLGSEGIRRMHEIASSMLHEEDTPGSDLGK
jgi:pimeloyl-ACP methyl ester carboxylesterase